MMSGLMGTMAQGMAFGVGSSVANRAVDSMMGPRQTEVVHKNEDGAPAGGAAPAAAAPADVCFNEKSWMEQCMNTNGGSEMAKCDYYADLLKQCRTSGQSMSM